VLTGESPVGREALVRSFVPAKIGNIWMLLDALPVQEVLGARPWVSIPHSSSQVAGVLAWRGRAIAVFDLSSSVEGCEPLQPGVPRSRTLIVEARSCALAMPVDMVHEVREVADSRLRPPHGTRMQHSSGEVEIFGTIAPILDVDALIKAILGGEVADDH
jgi:chemotaxis signal transduction protein